MTLATLTYPWMPLATHFNMKLHIPSVLIGVAFFLGMSMTQTQVPVSQQKQVPSVTESVVLLPAGITQAHLDILDLFTLEDVDRCGTPRKTLVLEGVNLQIVNGQGTTDTLNGLGNLIVGYNEAPLVGSCDDSGSHNIVGGVQNSYSSFGGLVVGVSNNITNTFSSILGGTLNTSNGARGVIVGGANNVVSWIGIHNVVVGGSDNVTSGDHSVIVGGDHNSTAGTSGVVVGGEWNETLAPYSVVTGGWSNTTVFAANWSVVSGGLNHTAAGIYDWIAGSLFEDN